MSVPIEVPNAECNKYQGALNCVWDVGPKKIEDLKSTLVAVQLLQAPQESANADVHWQGMINEIDKTAPKPRPVAISEIVTTIQAVSESVLENELSEPPREEKAMVSKMIARALTSKQKFALPAAELRTSLSPDSLSVGSDISWDPTDLTLQAIMSFVYTDPQEFNIINVSRPPVQPLPGSINPFPVPDAVTLSGAPLQSLPNLIGPLPTLRTLYLDADLFEILSRCC